MNEESENENNENILNRNDIKAKWNVMRRKKEENNNNENESEISAKAWKYQSII